MKAILLLVALSLSCALSGCISDYGQYRGAANGVEIRQQTDGTRIINVSGDASATVDKDGVVKVVSKSSIPDLIELIKATQ